MKTIKLTEEYRDERERLYSQGYGAEEIASLLKNG